MQLERRQLVFIIFGWFICPSFELSCIQCTSPVERITQNWDHSCLDGTLASVACKKPNNESSEPFLNCVSALYRIGLNTNGGKKS
ncbi:unnamed protein product [Adineta ricciae]|uniref:Uncharacterized protein n=1 Tax=Adineta ricciae TaxID=249248 RepID=A0A815FP17_ADIRI|nr:unnamed protein product [Adineta ricciae]CAF1328272.1 unnamed protein product [Adineta ricciae]